MKETEHSPEDLRKFLLGQMPRADRMRIETQRISDSALNDAIDLAESLLIDDHVENLLPADQAQAFDEVFLTTDDRKDRLAMSTGIRNISAQDRARRKCRIAVAFSVIAVLIGLVLYERANAVHTLRLSVNNTKSGDPGVLSLADTTSTLIIEFDCPIIPPTHTLTFGRIGDPTPLVTVRIESPATNIIKLPVQKSMLAPGDYLAILSAGEQFRADFRFVIAP